MKRIALPYLEGFLFLILVLFSCGPDRTTSTTSASMEDESGDLQVIVSSGRMRDEPSTQGNIISQLEKGQILHDLGEVSEQTTQILYGTENFDEPWLQVRGQDEQIGWIYAREVAPLNPETDLANFRLQKQLQSIFGKKALTRLHHFQHTWEEANTDTQVAETYQEGLALRDTLLPFLEKKSYSYTETPLPDLFWIGDHIPAYVPQLVAEGTIYYLFNDYGQWLEKAKNSQGRQDDRFFSLMVKCFPQDSIEYFYPAWEMQTWDYGGHSLLGRGIIYKILSGIEQIKPQIPLFSKGLEALKNRILNDVTQPGIHFWEPDSLVVRELDSIIQANWSIFGVADRVALETLKQQLDNPALHDIRFNARAGEQ